MGQMNAVVSASEKLHTFLAVSLCAAYCFLHLVSSLAHIFIYLILSLRYSCFYYKAHIVLHLELKPHIFRCLQFGLEPKSQSDRKAGTILGDLLYVCRCLKDPIPQNSLYSLPFRYHLQNLTDVNIHHLLLKSNKTTYNMEEME